LIAAAPTHLAAAAWLWLEHGYDQAPAITELLHRCHFRNIISRYDLAGQRRISGGKRP
jgi:release factor glutamine methyltransferase